MILEINNLHCMHTICN